MQYYYTQKIETQHSISSINGEISSLGTIQLGICLNQFNINVQSLWNKRAIREERYFILKFQYIHYLLKFWFSKMKADQCQEAEVVGAHSQHTSAFSKSSSSIKSSSIMQYKLKDKNKHIILSCKDPTWNTILPVLCNCKLYIKKSKEKWNWNAKGQIGECRHLL